MKRSLRITAAVVLVLVLVAAPTAATAAPVLSSRSAADDYTPSKSKWRGFMINVLGSVLGEAMPNPWQREQIANKYAQNGLPSNEQLNAMYGYRDMVRNPDGQLIPRVAGHGTYDDVVLREYEDELSGKSTRKKIKVPAIKPTNFAKNVAGIGSVVLGLPLGFSIGSGIAEVFGLDSAGAVCTASPENADILTQFFTGVDCEAYRLADQYVPNADIDPNAYVGATFNGGSITLIGVYDNVPGLGAGNSIYCYTFVQPSSWTEAGTGKTVTHGVKTTHPNYKPGGSAYPTQQNYATGVGPFELTSSTHPYASICGVGKWYVSNINSGVLAKQYWTPPLYSFVYTSRATGDPSAGTDPGELPDDPERSMTCKVTYTDGSTDTMTGEPYRESEGQVSPLACPEPDDGKTVQGIAVTENGSGATQELFNQPTTDAYKDQASREECTTGVCLLDLLIETAPDTYASCFDREEGCVGWFEDPAKADHYTCMYGTEEVDLDECAVYAGLFIPGRTEAGAPYNDPLTGIWSGGQNAPKASQGAMGYSVQDPAKVRSCDFDGLGFDPVGWVLRPVQCAMEWSFVPRPTVVEAQFAGVQSKWEGKPPVVLANFMSTVAMAPQGSGCSQSVTLFGSTFKVLDACSGGMAVVAGISKVLTTLGMIVLVLVVLRRQVAAMVGYNQGQG